ncbi:MFS transporter [Candidatus Burkholderia verschuerenii]|uniref:MFS transporter n=1 Tax=Candidatus Burkholderia verschuerenii TaxID=242163 RepID=UPI0009FA52A0|nr:MFS transporter [Candidatus Burkholderia verschuerenii]
MSTPQSQPQPHGGALASAVRKIKWHVLPLFVVMFIVNYIDRVNIGFVRQHLSADLGIGAAAYGLGAGLFFVSYAVFEVPSNMLLQRFGAKAWLTRIMITWGLAAVGMAFVQGETSFYAMRLVLGAAEAGFFPGVVFYFTQWLPREQRGRAMAVFLSGSALASVFSGSISGGLMMIEGAGKARACTAGSGCSSSKGMASVVLAGFVWFWLDSKPRDAKWLTRDEQDALVANIEDEQRQRDTAHTSAKPSAWSLMRDPQIVIFCLIYFSVSLTIYGATFWLPSIIRKMGHLNDFQVGLFNSIPWLISIAAMYFFASLAAKFKFQQAWVSCVLVIAAVGMYAAGQGSPVFSFVAICFAAIGFKAASSLFWPIPQDYLDTRIAAPVIALINSIGNLGGFVAPATFGFLEQKTGSIQGGLTGLAVMSVVAAVLVFLARMEPRHGKGQSGFVVKTKRVS